MKRILHAVDNNILQNLLILREDVGMAEEIYGPSVPHLKFKTFHHKVNNVDPIIVPNAPNGIHDRYKNTTICCELMHNNGILLLNTISRHIIFATGSMNKNRKVKNIEDGIKQVKKLYLKRGFNITRIHADS